MAFSNNEIVKFKYGTAQELCDRCKVESHSGYFTLTITINESGTTLNCGDYEFEPGTIYIVSGDEATIQNDASELKYNLGGIWVAESIDVLRKVSNITETLEWNYY